MHAHTKAHILKQEGWPVLHKGFVWHAGLPTALHDPSSKVSEMNVWWGQTQYVTFDPRQTLEQHIILLVDCDEHACVWECESVSWCLCLALTLVTCAFFPFCGRESAVYPAETHIQLEYGSDSFQTDSIQVVNHTAKNSWSNKVCCEYLLTLLLTSWVMNTMF